MGKWRRHDGKRSIQTARHEAAHAVCAEYLGLRCVRVELLGSFHGNTYFNANDKATGLTQAISVAAGSVAEHIWHRLPRNRMSRGDRRTLGILYRRPRERAAVMAATESVVRYLATAIQRVAKELKRRDLTGREVRAIMRDCGFKPGAKQR